MNKPRILLDCDGVLSDFIGPALDLIYEKTGDRHYRDEITQWDVFAALGKKDVEHILEDAVMHSKFCSSLPLLPGAKEAVDHLRTLGEVLIVTSPYNSPMWVYERNKWLEHHLGFSRKQVIHTAAKYAVSGLTLVDDSDRNLYQWHEHNKNGLPLLVDQPWNKDNECPAVVRTSGWNDIISRIESCI